ncbi:Hexokinase [Penicillium chermesinum]|uniref:Hexokinase n=1 Tax=Penicillium chermesinum TaxID=63820 RepID=A0A9W9PK22_9EURO|nr:Hexokinase [Penicillium chermesinum]KAJ5248866.1 Hexokinase [Penicillium chermesinum]
MLDAIGTGRGALHRDPRPRNPSMGPSPSCMSPFAMLQRLPSNKRPRTPSLTKIPTTSNPTPTPSTSKSTSGFSTAPSAQPSAHPTPNSASQRKTKSPLLALTVLATEWTEGNMSLATDNLAQDPTNTAAHSDVVGDRRARERETWITQEIPIKILGEAAVEGLHEPHCPDPEVHIALPGLAQLKSISDRFTRLASSDAKNRQPGMAAAAVGGVGTGEGTTGAAVLSTNTAPKLEFSANMHGKLKLAIATDELRIESVWSGLVNPPLDPAHISHDQYSQLPSERMRELGEDDELGWAKVRIDGKDWSRVLSIGRLSPKVVACFINDTALVLYVYLPNTYDGEESCLTYYINSFTT